MRAHRSRSRDWGKSETPLPWKSVRLDLTSVLPRAMWSGVLKQWPWPRLPHVCRFQSAFSPAFLSFCATTCQGLTFPEMFPYLLHYTDPYFFSHVPESLVLGGLSWQPSSSLNFFLAGLHLCVWQGEGVNLCVTEKRKGCVTRCKRLWLASYILLCEVPRF